MILIPRDGTLGLAWIDNEFEPDGWIAGTAAVGYDEQPDYHPDITTDVDARMNDVNTSAYLRIPFTKTGPAPVDALALWMRYDDGFGAYLNGYLYVSCQTEDSLKILKVHDQRIRASAESGT
jgi:hypothetical protein